MKRLLFIFLLCLSLLCSCTQNIGSYLSEFRFDNDSLPDGNGNKIKVIILSGQSNATGCSWPEYLSSDPDYATYCAGYDNVLINYVTENSNMSNGFVPVSLGQGFAGVCFGPEVGMAAEWSCENPTETILIIKYAYGGANLFKHFNSVTNGPMYSSLVSFVSTNLDYLVSKGYEPEVIGFCWMQGESDSFERTVVHYQKHEKRLFCNIRSRFAAWASADGIRIVDAGISEYWPCYLLTNGIKQKVASDLENVVFIDTIKAGLTTEHEPYGNVDKAHYDASSEILLGKLFVQALSSVL